MADSDARLADIIVSTRGSSEAPPSIGLTGGSLWRTVGGPGAIGRLYTGEAMHLPIDLVRADIEGETIWFVAHLVARRGWSRVFAMNSDWWGRYQLGPRAHPDDGLVDVYQATLRPTELFKVARRARNGAHLPHPAVKERRVRAIEISLGAPHRLWVDGRRHGRRCSDFTLTVEPDAAVIVV